MGALLAQTSTPGRTGALRTVSLTRDEAEMMIRIVEDVTSFAKNYPVEFLAYCPQDRWQHVLEKAGQGVHILETQLSSNAENIIVSMDNLAAIVDLEECAVGARDKRLSSGKLALIVAASGVFAQSFLGLSYVATPAYIAALAISLGRPLVESQKDPEEPFKPSTAEMGCAPRKQLGDHTDKAKVLERVIVPVSARECRHHWGTLIPAARRGPGSLCLAKGKWRVRVEGWLGDRLLLEGGWIRVPDEMCATARNEIAVWDIESGAPRDTGFGEIPLYSGHAETFWIEYSGPFTGGAWRRAGPFG